MSWLNAIPIISEVVGGVKGYLSHKQRLKEISREAEVELAKKELQAVIDSSASAQEHNQTLEGKLLDNSGWKDEYWTIILSIPFIACFIPGLDKYVLRGFAVLDQTPEWYQWIAMTVILAPFGVRLVNKTFNGFKK